jgi:hypothetical protein
LRALPDWLGCGFLFADSLHGAPDQRAWSRRRMGAGGEQGERTNCNRLMQAIGCATCRAIVWLEDTPLPVATTLRLNEPCTA